MEKENYEELRVVCYSVTVRCMKCILANLAHDILVVSTSYIFIVLHSKWQLVCMFFNLLVVCCYTRFFVVIT